MATICKQYTHQFSSLQYNLPENLTNLIVDWGEKHICDGDIYTDEDGHGRELESHITVLYGIHDEESDRVRKLLEDIEPFSVLLRGITCFNSPEKFDVVKVDVSSLTLHFLNNLISKNLPTTQTYSEYKPHLTVAYVKKGKGKKYQGKYDFSGINSKVNKLVFSSFNGNKDEIFLSA